MNTVGSNQQSDDLQNSPIQHYLTLSYCLGEIDYLYTDIDKIYASREEDYFEVLSDIDISLSRKLTMQPLVQVHATIKAFAITALAAHEGNYDSLFNLIRKGYRKVWEYVKKNKEFDAYKYSENQEQTAINRDLSASAFSVADSLCFLKEYPVFIYKDLMEQLYQHRQLILYNMFTVESKQKADPVHNLRSEKLIHLIKNLQKSKSLEVFFNSVTNEYEGSLLKGSSTRLSKKTGQREFTLGSCEPYISVLHSMNLRYFGIIGMEWFKQIQPDKHMIDHLTALLEEAQNNQRWTDEQLEILFISFLFFCGIHKDYQIARKLALSESQGQLLLDIKHMREEFDLYKKDNMKEKRQTDSAAEQSRINTEKLEKELLEKELEIQELRSLIRETKSNNKEVIALRKLVASLRSEEEKIEPLTIDMDEMIRFLSRINGVIIGGHQHWQQRLREKLTNFRFVHVVELNRSFKFIESADAVFVNTTVLSHSMYFKLMNHIEAYNTKFYFLGEHTNIELNVEDIYKLYTTKFN
ncbi:hypothetical protein HP548_02485 [Paenibacillus taichungensis]|uniref:DUF2325 domain-containing protein n=1 Tax=Paenibacillus taichungensis TaxID=484184 RepID=A0ABX2MIN3_9BACL|nr:hypothetical protein [Paenibacillus taichungensis]NUU52962.1 hypothetical protein [Paenibacillus taichungensis]